MSRAPRLIRTNGVATAAAPSETKIRGNQFAKIPATSVPNTMRKQASSHPSGRSLMRESYFAVAPRAATLLARASAHEYARQAADRRAVSNGAR